MLDAPRATEQREADGLVLCLRRHGERITQLGLTYDGLARAKGPLVAVKESSRQVAESGKIS